MLFSNICFFICRFYLCSDFIDDNYKNEDKLNNIDSSNDLFFNIDLSAYDPIIKSSLSIFCKELKYALYKNSIFHYLKFFAEIDEFNINKIDFETKIFISIANFFLVFKNINLEKKIQFKTNLSFCDIKKFLKKINKKVLKNKFREYDDRIEFDRNKFIYYINYEFTVPSLKSDKLFSKISIKEIRQFVKAKQKFFIHEKKHDDKFFLFDNKDYDFVVLPLYKFKEKDKLFLHKNTFSIFMQIVRILSVYHKNYFIFKVKESKNNLKIEFLYINNESYFSNIYIKNNLLSEQTENIKSTKDCNNLIRKVSSKISRYLNSPRTFDDKILFLNSKSSTIQNLINSLQKEILSMQNYYQEIFLNEINLSYMRFNDLLNVNFTHFLYSTELKNKNFIFDHKWNFLYLLLKKEKHVDMQIEKTTKKFIKLNGNVYKLIKKNNRLSMYKYKIEPINLNLNNYNFKASSTYKNFLIENFNRLNQEIMFEDINMFMLFYLFDYKNTNIIKYKLVFEKVKAMFEIIYSYSQNIIKLRLANLSTYKNLLEQEKNEFLSVESHLEITNADIISDQKNKNHSDLTTSFKKSSRWTKNKIQIGIKAVKNIFCFKIVEQSPMAIYNDKIYENISFVNVKFHLRYGKEANLIVHDLVMDERKFFFVMDNNAEKEIYENENFYNFFKER